MDDEQAFLATYDASRYPRPSVAVDVVLLTVADDTLKTLLVRRTSQPQQGLWALPGTFLALLPLHALSAEAPECAFGGGVVGAAALSDDTALALEQLGDPKTFPECFDVGEDVYWPEHWPEQ